MWGIGAVWGGPIPGQQAVGGEVPPGALFPPALLVEAQQTGGGGVGSAVSGTPTLHPPPAPQNSPDTDMRTFPMT